jgi:ribosomal protein S18 acetylase RimI-like enzyme
LIVRHSWIEGDVPVVIIRDFDHSRDSTALRDWFVELQNYERQFDPGKPEGSTIAEAYLNRMWARCRQWGGQVFVAEVAGQVVGFACVWARVKPDEPDDDPSEYAFVSDLVVGSTYRRRGIGSQLLSAAECYARARGARSLRIAVLAHNVAARRLYTSAGFEEYEVELAKQLG